MKNFSFRRFVKGLCLVAVAIIIICMTAMDLEAKSKKKRSGRNKKTSYTTAITGIKSDKYIVIDKPNFTLTVYSGNGETEATFPVCLGKGVGQKQRAGDHRTPEGDFKVSHMQPSSSWTHDFKDGKGARKGAYGPWFFRLNCKQSSHIGIHGTCFPETTGTRASDGCIRLKNDDLQKLREYVYVGMPVKILPD